MADEAMLGTTVRDCSREGAAAPLVPIVRQDSMAAYVMTHYEGVCHQGMAFITIGRCPIFPRVCDVASSCSALTEGVRGGGKRQHPDRGCAVRRQAAAP